MKFNLSNILLIFSLLFSGAFLYAENLASGKHFEFIQKPNYPICTNGKEFAKLTDGKFLDRDGVKIWMDPEGTVGWRTYSSVDFSVDLGEAQPISKVRYHTGAGIAGVRWPIAVFILASTDGKTFAYAGELVKDSSDNLPEYMTALSNRWMETTINVNARYIAFHVKCNGMFHFVDEIEILKGDESDSRSYESMLCFSGTEQMERDFSKYFAAYGRFNQDLEVLTAGQDVEELKTKIFSDAVKYLENNTTIAPFNLAQKEIIKLRQRQAAVRGQDKISIWTAHRWEPVHIFTNVPENASAEIELFMLKNELRSRTINFCNLSNADKVFELAKIPALKYYRAVAMDNARNFFNANMLQEIEDGKFIVPSGTTQQLWLEINSAFLNVGQNQLSLNFDDKVVPVTAQVADISFPVKLSSSFGSFDYLNNLPSQYKGVNKDNYPSAKQIITRYQVDAIWGNLVVIPRVNADNFSADDRLIKQPDFSSFDEWQERFAEASKYMLYFHAGRNGVFAGIKQADNPESFEKRISEWLKAWNEHLEKKSDKGPIYLHVIDEAGTPELKILFDTWVKVIKNSAISDKSIKLYFNPRLRLDEDNTYDGADILISSISYEQENLFHYLKIANSRPAQASFGFYHCSGNARELDPLTYYYQPVFAGVLINNYYGFDLWSLVGAPESFDEYDTQRMTFSPLYFNEDKIYPSKQIEAIYNARQDYEYFVLLKNKLGEKHPFIEELKNDFLQEIFAMPKNYVRWDTEKDRARADERQVKMWKELNKK